MRHASMLLGAGGFALCMGACASWIADPSEFTVQTICLMAISILGGLLAVRLPGVGDLPASLPLVGAMALTAGAPASVIAAFGAGLVASLSPLRDDAPPEEELGDRLRTGWGVGGTLALGAGLAASGFSRINLTALFAVSPSSAAPQEIMKTALALLAILFFSWLLASVLRRQRRMVDEARARARTGFALVESIALAIEAKDRTSERHLRRMRVYTVEVGRRLGLRAAELESLEQAALLHDIGKLVVPESILSKPAGLSSEEFQIMSMHARIGAEILETTSVSPTVVSMVRHHHERYDGSGYPDGLVGVEIPLGARILAAVDTFEALTSQRSYRPSMPLLEAIAFLQRSAGTLYDPRVVRVLVEHHVEFEAMVVAEEGRRTGRRTPAAGVETLGMPAPFQTVLDRIASSHMEIYSLHEFTQALGKTLNLEESFALIAGKVQRLLHYTSCAIYVFDPETEALIPRFATGPGAPRIMQLSHPLGQHVSGWAALQRRTAVGAPSACDADGTQRHSDLADLFDDPEMASLKSSLAAPLMVDDTLVGVMTLYDHREHEYTDQEEQLLALIARQVAAAVRTGLLFEQTQEHALTDSLTGLPNTRYMFIAFDREAEKARAQGSPLTLVVMDIDKFRNINDDFGHHAGDRFLVGMARAVRNQMRICDTCIRYSGDEFVAILPGLAGQEAEAVVERMTEAARDYCLEARPGRPVRLDLSIGFATMPADGDDFESLMAAAEARMKQQKALHREREDVQPERDLPGRIVAFRRH